MTTSALGKKLQIKPGNRVLLLDAPEGFAASLEPLPEGAAIATVARGRFDVVHLFARDSRALSRSAAKALDAVADGGVLWIAYPKKSSGVETDLTRDIGWKVVEEAGWGGVAQHAIEVVDGAPRRSRAPRARIFAVLLALAAGCGGRSDLPDAPGAAASPDGGAPGGPDCVAGKLDCDSEPGCEVDPLNDPAHCGACGHSCGGGACLDGVCQPVKLADVLDPGCLALDEAHVYVPDAATGEVLRVPKTPGAPVVLAAQGGQPRWVAVRDGWVYWTAPPEGLWRVPAAGGAAALVSESNLPLGPVAVDQARVFVGDVQAFGSILAAPLSGGELTPLVNFADLPGGIAVDEEALYWAEGSSVQGSVQKMRLSDQTVSAVAEDQVSPALVTLDGGHLYWITLFQGGAVTRAPTAGGAAEIVAGDLAWPTGVAVDGAHVYFTAYGQLEPGYGVLARVPKEGGAQEILASGRDLPLCVVVDGEAAYWVELGAQAVFKLAL